MVVAPLSCAVMGCALRQATAIRREWSQRVWPTRAPHEMASVCKALKNIALGNKPRRQQPSNTSDDPAAEFELVSLPNAIPGQYLPLVLIHAIPLSAALVLLPQTPIPNLPLPPPAHGFDKSPTSIPRSDHCPTGADPRVGMCRRGLARTVVGQFVAPMGTRRNIGLTSYPATPCGRSIYSTGHLECLRLHCVFDSGTTRGGCVLFGASFIMMLLSSPTYA
ncbi:hypothetical protein BC826DRAFT_567658 [Russula brevipes]|nr:hypothetical protein BC826DRAFT_567658 [Russula brevipes]